MAKEKMSLTKLAIRDAETPVKGRRWIYDTKTAGLCLSVTSRGAKSLYWKRWTGRGAVTRCLGSADTITIDQARKLVLELNAAASRGEDTRKGAGRDKDPLFADMWVYFYEHHSKPRKRTHAEDARQYDRFLSRWAKRRASEVTRADVQKLHTKMGEENGHYAANRVLALLSVMYNVAAPALGYEGLNPCRHVKKYREESRDRFLAAHEVKALYAALEYEGQQCQDLIRMLLLTGARKSNVLAMRWDEVNLERGLWRVPEAKSKSGDALAVVLPDAALKILRRRAGEGESEYVFPGRIQGHAGSPKCAWERIRKRAGLADVRMHDLRRTLGSWAAAGGAGLPLIGRMLGHRNTASTAVYARIDTEPVRALVESTTRALLAAANGEESEQ